MLRQIVFAISVVAGVAAWLMSAPAFREVTVEALGQQQPPPQQRPQEVTIDLLARGAQPKLAIPDFAVVGDDAELRGVATTVADVLWRDLRFEQEFYLIDRKESAKIPAADSPETLAYDRWFELGADFVVMGLVRKAGSEFEIDIRLIGVRGDLRGKQGFGSKYGQCSFKNPRYCAHYIADDMHKKIRGLDGVARTKIAFTSDRDASRLADRPLADSAQSKEIYISDYDGANQYRVTANRSLNLGPAWGPDLRTLAYVSYVTRFPDIYVANIHEARPPARPAAGDTRVHNFLPAISPDGSKVAFASPRDGSMDIWVVNRDGSGLKNLTPNTRKSDENGPAWSPTGTQIAFTSDRTGTNQIWAMGADGFGAERLTSDLHCDRPAWSSRGYIAYTYGSGPGHEIAFIDLSTRKVTILTDGVGTNGSPTVAPNGRHVAFVTTRWGKNHVAIINVKGEANNMTRVTESGNNTYPNWSPSPGK